MGEELLDDLDAQVQPERQSTLSWLAIALLWLGIVLMVVFGNFFHPRVLGGALVLLIATIGKYFYPKPGNILAAVVIFIGAADLLYFYPFNYIFALEIGSFALGIDLVLLFILLLHVWANKATFSEFYKSVRGDDRTEAEVLTIHQSKLLQFKRRFADKTLAELKVMTSNERLVPEAIEAAKALVEEKTSTLEEE